MTSGTSNRVLPGKLSHILDTFFTFPTWMSGVFVAAAAAAAEAKVQLMANQIQDEVKSHLQLSAVRVIMLLD